mmetsp:Transcript_22006/g.64802  ORF Transcript_22006/g.64802 Transcript_22006/m.64802 type:complete len:252 (+) Transcript_22006:176-931(+)
MPCSAPSLIRHGVQRNEDVLLWRLLPLQGGWGWESCVCVRASSHLFLRGLRLAAGDSLSGYPRRHPFHLKAKEEEQSGVVDELDVGEPRGKHRLGRKHERGVQHAASKLGELEVRELALERVVETERGDEVVRVHQHVRHAVDEGAPDAGAAAPPLAQQRPPDHAHGGVVEHLQKGHLPKALAPNHEEGVGPVHKLAQVVHKHEPLGLLVALRVHRKRVEAEHVHLGREPPHHVGAHDNLKDVVDRLDILL